MDIAHAYEEAEIEAHPHFTRILSKKDAEIAALTLMLERERKSAAQDEAQGYRSVAERLRAALVCLLDDSP